MTSLRGDALLPEMTRPEAVHADATTFQHCSLLMPALYTTQPSLMVAAKDVTDLGVDVHFETEEFDERFL